MRIPLITAAVLAALTVAPIAAGRSLPVEHLTMAEAREGSSGIAEQMLVAFTETPPTIRVRDCKRESEDTARCWVDFRGDRLRGRVRSKVRKVGTDQVTVWFSHLRVK